MTEAADASTRHVPVLVAEVLAGRKSPQDAVADLMLRRQRDELDGD